MEKDVHTEHCCIVCGCKYGEDQPIEVPDSEQFIECTVVSGLRKQRCPHGEMSICNGW